LPLQEFEPQTVQVVVLSLNQVAISARTINAMMKITGSFSHLWGVWCRENWVGVCINSGAQNAWQSHDTQTASETFETVAKL